MANETSKSQLFFLMRGDIFNKWCLGHINNPSGLRFCIAACEPNNTHCSIASHKKETMGFSEFQLQQKCFYIQEGINSGQAVARKEPFIHPDNVPMIKCNMFVNEAKTLAQWTMIFIKLWMKSALQDPLT